MAINKKSENITEGKFQADCFQWFHNSFPHLRGLLYHVPNGEERHKAVANQLKAKGVVAGIPDLVFHYYGYTYFFELKNPDGKGKVSPTQKKIHDILDVHGFIVWVIDDFEYFKQTVEMIVKDRKKQMIAGLTKADYYYRHKIFDYIYSIGDCEIVKIEDICEPETIPKFVKFISDFITEGYDKLSGFELLFTPDYKAFYKKLKGTERKVIYNGSNIAVK